MPYHADFSPEQADAAYPHHAARIAALTNAPAE